MVSNVDAAVMMDLGWGGEGVGMKAKPFNGCVAMHTLFYVWRYHLHTQANLLVEIVNSLKMTYVEQKK